MIKKNEYAFDSRKSGAKDSIIESSIAHAFTE